MARIIAGRPPAANRTIAEEVFRSSPFEFAETASSAFGILRVGKAERATHVITSHLKQFGVIVKTELPRLK